MADNTGPSTPQITKPLLVEAVRSLYGAYRLARGDRSGLTWFNPTLDGFWRSFLAAVLIFPLFAGLRALSYSLNSEALAAPLRIGLIESIAYVVSWVVFPLIMFYIARILGVRRNFFRFMVAYNWAMVWQNVVYMAVAFLALGGVLNPELATLLSLIVIVALFVYSWFITMVALDVPSGSAVAVVILDFLLGLFLHGMSDRMLMG